MRDKNTHPIAPSSRSYFENGMYGHYAVQGITAEDEHVYVISRSWGRSDVRVYVADIYIASEADIIEICRNHKGIDCIVLIGFFNRYSQSAKSMAGSMGVGLFDLREFYGALNYSGERFIDYEKQNEDNH